MFQEAEKEMKMRERGKLKQWKDPPAWEELVAFLRWIGKIWSYTFFDGEIKFTFFIFSVK